MYLRIRQIQDYQQKDFYFIIFNNKKEKEGTILYDKGWGGAVYGRSGYTPFREPFLYEVEL